MLRITTETKRGKVILSVEGRLAGPALSTLEECWRELRAVSPKKKLIVDLCGVSFIDNRGKVLLKEIHHQGGQLLAEGCLNQAIVSEILLRKKKSGRAEDAKGSTIIFYLMFLTLTLIPARTFAHGQQQNSANAGNATAQVLHLTLDQAVALGSMHIVLDKGQREDWLASRFIRVFLVLMVVGLIAGIIWELCEKEPVVDLRMLNDRNFAIATMAMFFLGFVLYSSTVLIPQLLQQLLGYTPSLAGKALSPGGAVIMCMMPVVGILVSRVDARYLITFGCMVSATALFVMAGWDLNLDFGHAVRARMLQSVALAFLFIPINVAAFAYVPKEKTNMGTGIINLAKNIGAGVGIATVTAMLEWRTQFHQSQLMERVNKMNPAYGNMTSGTAATLISHGASAARAAAQAQGMVYGLVQKQAAMMAFLDNFKFLGIVFFAVIPILLLMKKPKVPAGGVPVH